jgi:hypothetical protein
LSQTESYVQIAPDSTGKYIDCFTVTDEVTGATKYRQAVVVADPIQASYTWSFGIDYAYNCLPVCLPVDQDPTPVLRLSVLLKTQQLVRALNQFSGAGFVPSELPGFLTGVQ